jgi:hypothetical protein
LRALIHLPRRVLLFIFSVPYVNKHDRLSNAGDRALFDTQMGSGFSPAACQRRPGREFIVLLTS